MVFFLDSGLEFRLVFDFKIKALTAKAEGRSVTPECLAKRSIFAS
jgi:hypothetical protein